MLVLTRKVGEQIQIGDDITITVTRVDHHTVRIGVEAPSACGIFRTELAVDATNAETEVAHA